jgi:cyclophilin family peptidyl-prolyl cis-trans isomerase
MSKVRVVPGFLVQTGDKTGTGNGGESFYGGKAFLFDIMHNIHPSIYFFSQNRLTMKYTLG